MIETLEGKIRSKKAKVAIIGLGYVGLPLAVGFAKKGFMVFGVDMDPHRVSQIEEGKSYIKNNPYSALRQFIFTIILRW